MKSLHSLDPSSHHFLKLRLLILLKKYSSSSTPGPDHISWNYLKILVNNSRYITNFVNIANSCINLGHWLLYFKKSTLIIIPKPNKPVYNSLKTFWPIFLLNALGKLIEKAIGERLQIYSIASNFVHLN